MAGNDRIGVEAGEQHCLLIEPTDPRFKEASEATQAILESLQELGWAYGETRDEGTVVTRRFVSEHTFLDAFEAASSVVGGRAALQEVPCASIYDS